jgi:TolB-like protein
MKTLLADLRKRNVFRVAGVYAIAAWLVMQLVNVAMPALELPGWVDGFVLLLLTGGFLIALVFAWMFDLTPDGVVRADHGATPAGGGASGADYAIVVALAALLGVSVFQAVRGPAEGAAVDAATPVVSAPASSTPAVADASIAVLPFANLSADRDQEYFSDGLAEELMTQLAQFEGLHVAARTSSFAFKGRSEDLREIGRQLNVAHLLDGSVRRSGTQLRITAQLVNVQTGYQLWTKSFERELVDVFAIQEEIATSVAEALSVALRVGEITRIPGGTTNVEAYDRYLRAMALLNRGTPPGDLLRAGDLFREAVAFDPDFAVARANYALALARTLIFVPEQTAETVAELNDVVAAALARAPDHWSAHLADILVATQRRDWSAVDAAYRKVLALGPPLDASSVTWIAVVGASLGRITEVVRALQEARRADPLSIDVAGMLQQNLFLADRLAESQADYERSLDLPGAREMPEHVALMRIWSSGDRPRVEAQFRRFLEYLTLPMPVLNELAEVLDDPAAARVLLARAYQDPANQDSTRMMFIAWHAAHFGDDALAGAALRRALVDMNGTFVPAIWFPDLARYRQTQEFKQLVRDLQLYDYWRATGNWGDRCRPLGAEDFECK